MSRLAKKPIIIPSGVTATISDHLVINGPKGELRRPIPAAVHIAQISEGLKITVDHLDDHAERSLLGLWARLTENMIKGVTVGFEKAVEVKGIGYRVAISGKNVVLDIGFSHSVTVPIPEDCTATAEKSVLTVRGMDKQSVGGFVITLRNLRPPEPYKGKGIMIVGEVIRRKAGKAAKAAGAKA